MSDEHEGAEIYDFRPGFWLLVGKKPGPYRPRKPVLGLVEAKEYRPDREVNHHVATPAERKEALTPDAPKSAPRYKRVRPCEVCGVPFHYRNKRQRACSRECGGRLQLRTSRIRTALAEQRARVATLRPGDFTLYVGGRRIDTLTPPGFATRGRLGPEAVPAPTVTILVPEAEWSSSSPTAPNASDCPPANTSASPDVPLGAAPARPAAGSGS